MKILLATDGSECAQEAAWFLSHLPHTGKIDLTVLTVVHLPPVRFSQPTKSWMAVCVGKERTLAAEAFDKVERMFRGANAETRHLICEGNPGETIVEQAREIDADLVVLGARGHSAVDRMLLGSTSDFVATHADRSVLVVRPTGLRKEPDRPLYVALGYDDSGPSQAAIEQFSEFSWGEQTNLYVIAVVSYVSAFLNEVLIDSDQAKEAAEESLRLAVEQLREVAPKAQGHLVESDHIGEGITQFVEEHHFDLVVMGDSCRSALGRLVLGSVPHYVLRHAPCSIWIARQRQVEGSNKNSEQAVTHAPS